MPGAILAGGEGQRIQAVSVCKPLAEVHGEAMIARLLRQMKALGIGPIWVALRSQNKAAEKALAMVKVPHVHCFFVETPSSMHTLWEVSQRVVLTSNEHLFVSMVDTIIREEDLKNYVKFCTSLKPNESAILVTPFIDDEKPLFVSIDDSGAVVDIGSQRGSLVTSGMYCLSHQVFSHLEYCINVGLHRMRNFLSYLNKNGHTLKAFTVPKTVDIDRPKDITVAENFLGENQ